MFEKTMGTLAVAWHTRSELRERAAGYIKERAAAVKNNARMIKPVVLMFLLIALFCVVTARVKLDNERIREAQEAAAAEEMRLDQERQAAIRASTLAAREQEKAAAAEQHRAECEAVARVLAGVSAYGLSDAAKEAIIDVILNRADCPYGEFGDTVLEVCSKPGNWQGYTEGGAYLKSDYELAEAKLSGNRLARSIPANCYFLRIERGQVTARSEWDEAKAGITVTVS